MYTPNINISSHIHINQLLLIFARRDNERYYVVISTHIIFFIFLYISYLHYSQICRKFVKRQSIAFTVFWIHSMWVSLHLAIAMQIISTTACIYIYIYIYIYVYSIYYVYIYSIYLYLIVYYLNCYILYLDQS